MAIQIMTGDARRRLTGLPDESVHCCVTSPPYFGLRDYGVDGQIGLEETPDVYVAELVEVFREVRRVLRKDGTVWLNLGDSYSAGGHGGHQQGQGANGAFHGHVRRQGDRVPRKAPPGLKPKDLIGIPWLVAFALRADGWYLRSDIIWAKPNPMPESVTDRPTSAHEHVFLLSKSARYWYDADAVAEVAIYQPGDGGGPQRFGAPGGKAAQVYGAKVSGEIWERNGFRNLRNVWNIATHPYPEAHFATFPPKLAETCIKAGCPKGGTVLDPFGGSGTTGLVADRLQRDAILIELKPEYAAMAEARIYGDAPMFSRIECRP